MSTRFIRFGLVAASAVALASTSLLAGAIPVPAVNDATPVAPAPVRPRATDRAHVGRVVAIDPIRTRPQGSGLGAVAGGVVGGVLGHKIIGGTAATAVGAVGGAVAGNNLERNHREGVAGYHVHVRLDNGSARTLDRTQLGGLHVGDRVRIDGGRIRRL